MSLLLYFSRSLPSFHFLQSNRKIELRLFPVRRKASKPQNRRTYTSVILSFYHFTQFTNSQVATKSHGYENKKLLFQFQIYLVPNSFST